MTTRREVTAHDIGPKKDRPKVAVRLLSKGEVLDRIPLSWVRIWELIREGKFPRAVTVDGASISDGGTSMFIESEIDQWILSRPRRVYKIETRGTTIDEAKSCKRSSRAEA